MCDLPLRFFLCLWNMTFSSYFSSFGGNISRQIECILRNNHPTLLTSLTCRPSGKHIMIRVLSSPPTSPYGSLSSSILCFLLKHVNCVCSPSFLKPSVHSNNAVSEHITLLLIYYYLFMHLHWRTFPTTTTSSQPPHHQSVQSACVAAGQEAHQTSFSGGPMC